MPTSSTNITPSATNVKRPRRLRALLGMPVEQRVVDRRGGAAPQVLREGQRFVVVEPRRIGRDEHQRTERAAAGLHRHDHRRGHAQLAQHLELGGVAGRRLEHLGRDAPVEDRLAGAGYAGGAFRLVHGRGMEVARPHRPLRLVGILVDDGESPQVAVVADDVDRAPVGELRHDELSDIGEGGLVIERARQQGAHLREERELIARRTLPGVQAGVVDRERGPDARSSISGRSRRL